jgi:hypothetical protein
LEMNNLVVGSSINWSGKYWGKSRVFVFVFCSVFESRRDYGVLFGLY